MENPIKMDDLGGTTIFGNIHISVGIQSNNKIDRSSFVSKKTPWYLRYENRRPSLFPLTHGFFGHKFTWLRSNDSIHCPPWACWLLHEEPPGFAHRFWVVFGLDPMQPMHNGGALMCNMYIVEIWAKFDTRNNFINQIHMNCSWNEESYHKYLSRKWRNPDLNMLLFMRISLILPALWDWRTEGSCSALTLRTTIHPESVEAVYDRLDATKFIPSNFILFSSQKSMWGKPMLNTPLLRP